MEVEASRDNCKGKHVMIVKSMLSGLPVFVVIIFTAVRQPNRENENARIGLEDVLKPRVVAPKGETAA